MLRRRVLPVTPFASALRATVPSAWMLRSCATGSGGSSPTPPPTNDAAPSAPSGIPTPKTPPAAGKSAKAAAAEDTERVPKGFEAFYNVVDTRAPGINKAREAFEETEFERDLLDRHEGMRRNARRLRRAVVITSVLTGVIAYKTYTNYVLDRGSPVDEDGLAMYSYVLVDLPGHIASFVDEGGRSIARRCFIDYGAFETGVPEDKDVIIRVSSFYPLLPMALLMLLPLLAFFQGGFRNAARTAMMPGGADKKRFKFKKEHDLSTRLKDVAGLTEAKGEVVEIIDFLKHPKRFTQMGARLPKGVLLDGPPGVGKTLLAKAVAGEAMVPFVSCSGSEFEEVYVGVGARRVRELFKEARKMRPCVVFIDEIDAFGKKRNSERSNSRGTLNAFLAELDGFQDASGIIVLAATNRADVLDNALTRSGRFDRKISLEKPPHKDRVAISKVHLKPLKLDPGLQLEDAAESLASLTPGCSGADIFNVCNEAAIAASRDESDFVTMKHFNSALERVLVGLERKARTLAEYERERIAFHEAGHVVLSWFLPQVDPVVKSTIVPRGGSMVGVTQNLPHEVFIKTQERLRQQMVQTLGGFVAEEHFFHDLSSSAAEDLQKTTNLAFNEITTYGMDPKGIGHLGFREDGNALQKPYGPKKENMIDDAVSTIVNDVTARARQLLQERLTQVRIVAGMLLKNETITARELWMLLGDRPEMSDEFLKYLQSA